MNDLLREVQEIKAEYIKELKDSSGHVPYTADVAKKVEVIKDRNEEDSISPLDYFDFDMFIEDVHNWEDNALKGFDTLEFIATLKD